jgi:hypothetical protein
MYMSTCKTVASVWSIYLNWSVESFQQCIVTTRYVILCMKDDLNALIGSPSSVTYRYTAKCRAVHAASALCGHATCRSLKSSHSDALWHSSCTRGWAASDRRHWHESACVVDKSLSLIPNLFYLHLTVVHTIYIFGKMLYRNWGHAVAHLVEGLRYKPEGRRFDGVTGIFLWHNPSGRTMALGLTQPLTEMCTRNISWE